MKKTKPTLRFAVLATDVVIFTVKDDALQVLLVDVNIPPHFVGMHGVPGGLIDPKETARDAAMRHLKDKTGITGVSVEQLYTFSSVKRDPRGRVVSVAYFTLLPPDHDIFISNRKEFKTQWKKASRLPRLAYDHDEIVRVAVERLQAKISYSAIAQLLLPKTFTLTELQAVYEIILGHSIDKRNFRRKVLAAELLGTEGKKRYGVKNRPASLYFFIKKPSHIITLA